MVVVVVVVAAAAAATGRRNRYRASLPDKSCERCDRSHQLSDSKHQISVRSFANFHRPLCCGPSYTVQARIPSALLF